jgi:hypothetical protein
VIHQTGWQIRINPHDHKPEFLPPAHLRGERHWVRDRHPREERDRR